MIYKFAKEQRMSMDVESFKSKVQYFNKRVTLNFVEIIFCLKKGRISTNSVLISPNAILFWIDIKYVNDLSAGEFRLEFFPVQQSIFEHFFG